MSRLYRFAIQAALIADVEAEDAAQARVGGAGVDPDAWGRLGHA